MTIKGFNSHFERAWTSFFVHLSQNHAYFFTFILNSQTKKLTVEIGPRQANLVLVVYASSEGSGEPARPRSLARTFTARSYKQ